MTNLGFHQLMAEQGIRAVTTDVGDRYVLEALRREGGKLGGEQSGHVIWLDGHMTGDGLVAALLLRAASRGRTLAELAVLERFPQARRNVPVARRRDPRELAPRWTPRRGEGRQSARPALGDRARRARPRRGRPAEAEDLCGTIAALVSLELG